MQTNKERLIAALQEPLESTFANYKTSALGLVDDQVEENRDAYGENVITKGQEDSMIKKIYESIINPFTVILLVIALVSFITNVWLAKPGEQDPTTSIIIVTLVLISGGIRFIQELRSDKAASNLSRMIVNTATVLRDGAEQEIPIDEIVVGDVIKLSAGDMIPADVVLIDSRDFFVQQSGLTGESDAVEKVCLRKAASQNLDSLLESESLAFMGTNVISGRATALVLVVGDETMMGAIEQTINTYDEPTSFEREMNTISWLLIRLMLVMVPVVFVINGLTDGDWLEAGVFALSVGVGLTPEMLPMIITASLAKGSIIMAKEKVVIKKLNAIQDLGAIDILCTDKTGTLTQDEIVLEYPLDIHGELDLSVLRRAYLNSYFQTGLKNLMDRAIINRTQKEAKKHEIVRDLDQTFHKIDELPFDFERRRMSVIVKDEDGVVSMVTKGALEEMLSVSTYVEYKGEIKRLTDEVRQEVLAEVAQLNEQGLRVLGVSYKTDLDENDIFSVEDERDMILTGYLAFLDPPKPSAAPAIKALAELRLQQTEWLSQQSYEQTDARRLEETISQLEVEEHQLQLLIEQGEAKVQTVDVEQLANQLTQAQAKKTELEQGVIRKRFELDDLEGQAEDVAEQMEQARKKNEEWIRQQAKAEATREKHADRLNKLLTQITDEFMQSFDQAKEQAKPVENLAAAENQLKSIEKDIKALGPVNVDAIEQYDEVKGRFDFLSSQREDVLAAKNMLLSTINDMNDEVKERFKSTFEAIRESFKVTFRQMFGGGSADLILTEPDLLTAGVEISVQPPGKKIQSLNLMSGGEKALSALALLFSIIRVKTIPFVILDEVEAALDEANVKRFGDYLNHFDKESQFIVVTHRKGTMSAADSIYGVTMQESGVSKIVSVKLKDLENEE